MTQWNGVEEKELSGTQPLRDESQWMATNRQEGIGR